MKRRAGVVLVCMLVLVAVLVVPALAKGPANAGDGETYTRPNWKSSLYLGPDYGAGWTATETVNGTVIDPIGSPESPATLLAKGHYFSEWGEPVSERDWVYYKFWLNDPVRITFASGEEYLATHFIVITCKMASGEYTLEAYK